MVEYAHLVIKLDLKEAMAQVKEACENIQRTADHCRQHAHGMDIHELMLRQDDLCETYITRLQNQIYALGSEVRVKGMTDPFNSSRDKRQYQKFRGADETYAELVGRVKKEGKDGFVKKMGLPLSMRDDVGDRFCGFHDLVSDERSDHLKARCQAWWLPEMSEKMPDLRFTPEAVKIFEHFGDTQDVYYLRRNLERFMTMQPVTARQYLRRRTKKPFWKVYQRQDTWTPKLPTVPEKEEKGGSSQTTIVARPEVGRTVYGSRKADKKENQGSEEGSSEGLSTLDKVLLASDAARLANAVRKKANKKKMDEIANVNENVPTGKRKKILNKAGDTAKKFLDKAAWGRGFKKIKPILKLPRGKRSAEEKGLLQRVKRWVMKVKRQVGLVGMGSVLVGGYIVEHEWDWIKGQLGIGTGEPAAGVVQQVNLNEDHARILAQHVDDLEKATMELRHRVVEGVREEMLLLTYERVVGMMDQVKEQYDRLYFAVETLISTKRLSTAVVSPPDMYQEILAITSELRTEGLELLMEESQEIFEMEASYILFANMTLAIYVHLPVGKLGSSMKLYQFVPTPFRFENRSELFMVEPPRQLLASSPNVELVQVELSALDFELCDHIRSTYYCPARTRWTYDTRQSCLTALYRRDALVVNEKCPISAIPYEDMSVQLDEKTFILAVDGDEVFRFMCNEKLVSSMRLSGLCLLYTSPSPRDKRQSRMPSSA